MPAPLWHQTEAQARKSTPKQRHGKLAFIAELVAWLLRLFTQGALNCRFRLVICRIAGGGIFGGIGGRAHGESRLLGRHSVVGHGLGFLVELGIDINLEVDDGVVEWIGFLVALKELEGDLPLNVIALRVFFQFKNDPAQAVRSVEGELDVNSYDVLRYGSGGFRHSFCLAAFLATGSASLPLDSKWRRAYHSRRA